MSRSIRDASKLRLCGWPLVAVAWGSDFSRNEARGHARGIIAVGDVATGVIAIGGLARGLIAVGGVAACVFTVAGVGFGALVIAGVAIAQTAFGGVAIGHDAKRRSGDRLPCGQRGASRSLGRRLVSPAGASQ